MENRDLSLDQQIKRPGAVMASVWTALIGLSVLYWHFFGMLPVLGEHWPLTALVVIVGLMIAGKVGRGLGIPLLFRNAPEQGRSFAPAFWSGFGATLLCNLILTIMFICSWLSLLEIQSEFQSFQFLVNRVEREMRLPAGEEKPAGFAFMQEHPTSTSGRRLQIHLSGKHHDWRPHNLITRLFLSRPEGTHGKAQIDLAAIPAFLFVFLAGVPVWFLFAACVIGSDPPSAGLSSPRSLRSRLIEGLTYLCGWFVMMVLAVLCGTLHMVIEPFQFSAPSTASSGWWLLDGLLMFTRFQTWAHLGSFTFFLIFVILLPVTLGSFYRNIPPALGICLLFCLLAVAYLCLDVLTPGVGVVVALVFGAAIVFLNRRADRYRFPGMSWHYDSPIDLETKDKEVEGGSIPPGPLADDDATPLLLNDREILDRWAVHVRSLQPESPTKPKLVLLSVTGAAYRASFWTTIVLEKLEAEFPGFFDRVRLVTGASGGMVGAAYAVALRTKSGSTRSATEELKRDSGLDSLTPVVQQLIRRDIPLALHWMPQKYDRGRALEDQWKTLDITFGDLRTGEAEGWRPSLVISPMVVETGRRLLFSNLDLYGLTDLQARKRGGVSFEHDDRGPLPSHGGFRRLSRSAVEFFRAFPDTYQGRNSEAFKLKTAVRMNATFPFISPAVNLPVDPPRRVVDAGYYDNYGINLAASWAYHNQEWIRANTSGLAIVQIRAYESEDVRKRLWVSPRDDSAPRASRLGDLAIGLQALTTPFQGVMGAMTWSMSYRNDEQIQLLDQIFNGHYILGDGAERSEVNFARERDRPGWFESFVFENSVPFGMNWFVSAAEIDRMKESLDEPPERPAQPGRIRKLGHSHARQERLERQARDHNLAQLDHFGRWWNRPQVPQPAFRGAAVPVSSVDVVDVSPPRTSIRRAH